MVALAAQKKAAVGLRLVVDSLKAGAKQDSLDLARADETIALQKQNLADAYNRVDIVTNTLEALRKETRHKGDWNLPLGIHLPRWTRGAVLIGAAGYVGYTVGRGS
jgi:hypothetical protein